MTVLRDTTIASGGLGRCCHATIHGYIAAAPDAPADTGITVDCWCGTRVVLDGVVWCWDRVTSRCPACVKGTVTDSNGRRSRCFYCGGSGARAEAA